MGSAPARVPPVRNPAGSGHSPAPGLVLQRKCACGGTPSGDTKCESCRQKELGLQRVATGPSVSPKAPPIVHEVLRNPGQPLDPSTRAVMEPLFAFDFSRVRIHTDSRAAESARAVSAQAYSVGQHIVFGAGQYQPRTAAGQQLLTHELVHTLQQQEDDAGPSDPLAISHPESRSEREAERVAGAVMGKMGLPPVGREAAQIARQEDDDGDAGAPQDADVSLPGGLPSPPPDQADPATDPATQPAAEQSSTDAGATPISRHACVVTEIIPRITTPLAVFDDMVLMQTQVEIRWQPPGDASTSCDCSCGEYRQHVKGHMIINGRPYKLPLWGGAFLEENVWHEDGDPSANNFRYGHRDEPGINNDIFDEPNRTSGCHYLGKDQVSVPGRSGTMIDVDLQFKGQAYDKCADTWGQIYNWAFTYKGPLASGTSTP